MNIDNVSLYKLISSPARSLEAEVFINNYPEEIKKFKWKNGESALHIAILNPSIGVRTAVLDTGIDINIKDDYGRTPFDLILERLYFLKDFANENPQENINFESCLSSTMIVLFSIIYTGAKPGKTISQIKNGEDVVLLHLLNDGYLELIKVLYFIFGNEVFDYWFSNSNIFNIIESSSATQEEKNTIIEWLNQNGEYKK